MKIIERKMEATESISEISNNSMYCQASFNSDGVLTLRNYNIPDKNNDEILIFSAEETEAIFKLFDKLNKNGRLPF